MNEEGKVLVALIAAGSALTVAVVNAVMAYLGSRKDREHEKQLALIKATLDEQLAERSAYREYQYEAKKRLYLECEPLLFQLHLFAEDAISRIRNLAKASRNGKLGPGGWLGRGYYRLSTYYRVLAPLAIFRLMNRRLGLIDLNLDQRVYSQYLLIRRAYDVFGADFRLAEDELVDGYDPHVKDASRLRQESPGRYWQQGVPEGILANAVDALIWTDAQHRERVRTFADFENCYKRDGGSEVTAAIDRIGYLFEDFSPDARPILWSILLVQAHIYRAMLNGTDVVANLLEPAEFEWHPPGAGGEHPAVNTRPAFAAAVRYLSGPHRPATGIINPQPAS